MQIRHVWPGSTPGHFEALRRISLVVPDSVAKVFLSHRLQISGLLARQSDMDVGDHFVL